MSTNRTPESNGTLTDRWRDEYLEYDDGHGLIAVVQDPENVDAYVQSTLTVPIER